jgi:hypothetical protein
MMPTTKVNTAHRGLATAPEGGSEGAAEAAGLRERRRITNERAPRRRSIWTMIWTMMT